MVLDSASILLRGVPVSDSLHPGADQRMQAIREILRQKRLLRSDEADFGDAIHRTWLELWRRLRPRLVAHLAEVQAGLARTGPICKDKAFGG